MDFQVQNQSTAEASIKTYFLDEENKVSEIRRFVLPCPANVALLIEKIRTLYDIDSCQEVRIQWFDPEGDRVTLTTDEELADALSAVAESREGGPDSGDATLRVYVSLPPALVPAACNNVLHPDVVCDGCEQQLRGYRFKCVMCPDFDLCCHCVVLNRHCEHPMILLRRPRDPFICRLSKWNRNYWARRCRLRADGGGSGSGSGGGGGRGGDCPSSLPSDCVKFLRELEASAMKVVQQQQQCQQSSFTFPEICSLSSMDASVATNLQRCDSVTSSVVAGEGVPMASGVGAGGGTAQQEEMLRFVHSVSNSLNALLQPLGIDVSWHASSQSPTTQQAAAAAGAVRQTSPQQQLQLQQQQQQQGGDCAMAGDEAAISAADDAEAAAAATTATAAAAPTAVQPVPLPLPEHVAVALGQMQAMGFMDDGGRLSQLLLMANGDIDQVLDALRQS